MRDFHIAHSYSLAAKNGLNSTKYSVQITDVQTGSTNIMKTYLCNIQRFLKLQKIKILSRFFFFLFLLKTYIVGTR